MTDLKDLSKNLDIETIEELLARGKTGLTSHQANILGYYIKGLVEVVDNGLSSLAKWLWYVKEYRLWQQMSLESDGEKITFGTQEEFIAYLRKNPSVINQKAISRTTFFDLPIAYSKLVVEYGISEADFNSLGHRAIEIKKIVEHQEKEGITPDVDEWVEKAITLTTAHFESEIALAKGQDELKQTICKFPVGVLIEFLESTGIDEIKRGSKIIIFKDREIGEKGIIGIELE